MSNRIPQGTFQQPLLNLYESAPPEQHSVDFDVLLNEDIPVQHQDTSTARNIVIAQSTYVVVSRIYKPSSAPNSPLYITKLLEDVVDDYDSARYVATLCYTQNVVDPPLFTALGEEHVIPKEGIRDCSLFMPKGGPVFRVGGG